MNLHLYRLEGGCLSIRLRVHIWFLFLILSKYFKKNYIENSLAIKFIDEDNFSLFSEKMNYHLAPSRGPDPHTLARTICLANSVKLPFDLLGKYYFILNDSDWHSSRKR